MLPPILFYSFLHRRIFAVPQHLAELHGICVALRGEQQHLAEPVQADGLPQVLVLVRLHQGRDQAHAHRAGLAGDHRGVALHRHAQHPHAPGADPVRAGDEGGDMVAQNVPGEDVGLSAGQARHDGLEIAFHDPRCPSPARAPWYRQSAARASITTKVGGSLGNRLVKYPITAPAKLPTPACTNT